MCWQPTSQAACGYGDWGSFARNSANPAVKLNRGVSRVGGVQIITLYVDPKWAAILPGWRGDREEDPVKKTIEPSLVRNYCVCLAKGAGRVDNGPMPRTGRAAVGGYCYHVGEEARSGSHPPPRRPSPQAGCEEKGEDESFSLCFSLVGKPCKTCGPG